MSREFTFGFDLDNIQEVMVFVKDNYKEGKDYEMSIGYGDDVMNYLDVKSDKLLKDSNFLELISACDGEGEWGDLDDEEEEEWEL